VGIEKSEHIERARCEDCTAPVRRDSHLAHSKSLSCEMRRLYRKLTRQKTMLTLKEKPTLKDLQTYVEAMVKERGFDTETAPEIFMLFLEECGELAKAARKNQKLHTDARSQTHDLGHEAADVLIYLLDICNHFNIDLEKAFREKEELNKKRVWTK